MAGQEVQTLAVIRGGQMGRGIAQVAAQTGLSVRILDAGEDLARAARDRIDKTLARLVDKGKLSAEDRDAALGRIAPVADYGALSDCDLVVEAAPESEALKLDIFTKLDQVTGPAAILASNTSSISITKLSAATPRPDKVIGMHFMNPVPLMKLVEECADCRPRTRPTRPPWPWPSAWARPP